MRRTVAARIQRRLAATYALEELVCVDDFARPTAVGAREALLVREDEGGIEVAVHLPEAALAEEARGLDFDTLCQIVEGVSHFLYVVERARRELPATQLELELQAEVDKYVLLALAPAASERPMAGAQRSAAVRERLYERVRYLDAPDTETGERYRLANDLAARFASRLEARFAGSRRSADLLRALRRFYAAGQREKIELARAA